MFSRKPKLTSRRRLFSCLESASPRLHYHVLRVYVPRHCKVYVTFMTWTSACMSFNKWRLIYHEWRGAVISKGTDRYASPGLKVTDLLSHDSASCERLTMNLLPWQESTCLSTTPGDTFCIFWSGKWSVCWSLLVLAYIAWARARTYMMLTTTPHIFWNGSFLFFHRFENVLGFVPNFVQRTYSKSVQNSDSFSS